ncbi:MAG: hypothetical protein A3F54_04440 [Candidatus Kerfeldbacteria bacterium RIFCSPHIGHO2_12_FULL_48_17]|uniref:Fibronectin type-III domain-containing protein n=1 Tax=Candidatus Kerfeldbacteria bacterium RIFCSPHIGHO2_12_FULL_48_17 TaxID=1798542 RepID=A0A1G2B4B1_9BACT|nr:MAG: hypothetical protein A3F54_04440 [Candidatus Kerfeldbacteria bacterium RIFCSPHIGHO2_12_FULL_48_17]
MPDWKIEILKHKKYLFIPIFLGFLTFVSIFAFHTFLPRTTPPALRLSKDSIPAYENVRINIAGSLPEVNQVNLELTHETGSPVEVNTHLSTQKDKGGFFVSLKNALLSPVFASVNGPSSDFLEIARPRHFVPGKYHLKIGLPDQTLLEQDFYWGVLAVNTPKSVYHVGESVNLSLTVLDDNGMTICGGDAEMVVVTPNNDISRLATQDKSLHLSPKCGDTAVDAPPDYTADYVASLPGKYVVVARAQGTNSAWHTIEDQFTVEEATPFSVERHGPTRIYPSNTYPFTLALTATEEWKGEFQEIVPASFAINALSGEATIKQQDDVQIISWPVHLVPGQTTVLEYTFKAPEISPEFYILGPAKLGNDFTEQRVWQIAADAQTKRTCNWVGASSNAWGTAANWSCVFVPDNSGCSGTSNGICYYVSIENTTNNPVLLGSTSRTVSSFEIGTSTNGTSMTIDSAGSLTVEAQGGGVGGFTVGAIEIGGGGTTGTLNLNPTSVGTCLTTPLNSSYTPIKTSGTVTSSNSNCTWSHTGTTGTVTNAGAMSGSFSLSIIGGQSFTNSGTMNMSGGTFTTGGGAAVNCSNATRSNNKFYNFSTGTPSAITTLSGSCLIGGVLTVDNSTLNTGTGTHELSGSGTPLVVSGAGGVFSAGATNTMMYSGSSATNIAGETYSNLTLQPTSGSPTYTFPSSDTTTINIDLTIGNGTNAVTASTGTAGSDPNIDAKDDLTINANAALSGAGGGNITVNGNVSGGGTIELTGGTFEQRVAAAKNFASSSGSNNWAFNNLTLSNSSATSKTVTTSSGGSGGIGVTGTLRIGKSGDGVSANTVLDAGSRVWTLSGSTGSPLVLLASPAGSLTANASTMNFTDTADMVIPALTYYNLGVGTTSDSSAATTYDLDDTTTVNNVLTVGNASSTNTDVLNLGTYTLTLPGSGTPLNLTSKGALSPGTSTVNFTNATSATIPAAGYYHLKFSPASGTPTYTLASGTLETTDFEITGAGNATINADTSDPIVNIDGDLTIGSGDTFSASATADFTIAQDFTNNGTYTANSGGVTFDSSATSTITGATSFHDFDSSTAGKTIQFQSATGGAPVFTFGGTMALTGASGNKINLYSNSLNDQWLAHFNSEQSSLTYVNVRDAGCDTGTADVIFDNTSSDADGNGSCWVFSLPPNSPSTLAQKTTGNTAISSDGWTNSTSVLFSAAVSDPDAADNLKICVEAQPLGTGFTNTATACGSLVAYSGSPVTASVTPTLTNNTQYHWQARVQDEFGNTSSWVSFGTNAETASDFGIDTTAPSGGSVYDGTQSGTDVLYNDGSLTQLSANWSGSDATVSGLDHYEYSIGTAAGGTDIKTWTNVSADTSVTATGLTLVTAQLYYFNVRAVDEAGNTQSAVSSNGQRVLPIPPNSGFSPAEGARVASQKPTLSWNAPGDPAVRYHVCISKSNQPASKCTLSYTSNSGTPRVQVQTALTDETTYYWQVRSRDALNKYSSWSAAQSFYVNTSLDPELTITKTVGINVNTLSLGKDSSSIGFVDSILTLFGTTPTFAAGGFSSDNFSTILKILERIFMGPELLFFVAGLCIAAIMNLLFSVKHPKHLPIFLFLSPQRSFQKVAPRKKDGTFITSYFSYYKRAKSTKGALLSAVLLVVAKIAVGLVLSASLSTPSDVFAFSDNNKTVSPGDVLTYRVDWSNAGDGSATSFSLSDEFPDGTTYVAGSAVVNGSSKTDKNDNDAVTATEAGIVFSLGTLAEKNADTETDTGYVLFQVSVDNPATASSIANAASYVYSESDDAETTNTTTNPVTSFSISGTVFDDANRDEEKGDAETGFSAIAVKLYEDSNANDTLETETDALIASATTDEFGEYAFSNLGAATYFVSLDESALPSSDWKISTENGNPRKVIVDEDADKNDQNFGYYDSSIADVDADLPLNASIGDVVWHDLDRDKTQDIQENGLEGTSVQLFKNNDSDNHTLNIDTDSFIGIIKTNSNGNYNFTGLNSGVYFVGIDVKASDDISSHNYILTTDNNPKRVVLSENDQLYAAADFGFALPTSRIGDAVFEDKNANGLFDAQERGLSRVDVRLYADTNQNQTLEQDADTLVGETETSDLGFYSFDHVARGKYLVSVDEKTLPFDTFSLTTAGNPLATEITTNTNQNNTAVDFGFVEVSEKDKKVSESSNTADSAVDAVSEEDKPADYVEPTELENNLGENQQKLAESLVLNINVNDTSLFADGSIVDSNTLTLENVDSFNISGNAAGCAFCTVSILVYSDPLTFTDTTDAEGNWSVDIPLKLLTSEEHVIYAQINNGVDTSPWIKIAVVDLSAQKEDRSMWVYYIVPVLIVIVFIGFFILVRYSKALRSKFISLLKYFKPGKKKHTTGKKRQGNFHEKHKP